MKIILTLLLVLAPILSQAAFGVSERSVKKWDDEKLCKKAGELELKEDWKAVAIISKEIAARENLDVEVCADLEQVGLENKTARTHRWRSRNTPYVSSRLREAQYMARVQTLEKYGEEIFMDSVKVACGHKQPDQDIIVKARNYTVSVIPHMAWESGLHYFDEIPVLFVGFQTGFALAGRLAPDLCSDKGIAAMESIAAEYFENLNQPKTSQNIDLVFEIGTSAGEVLKEVGEPILTEQIGPIEAQHFCRTGEVDEYLVLYFFKGSLLYQSRYQVTAEQAGKSGDCVEFAGKGSYEIPEAIKAINASAKKEN